MPPIAGLVQLTVQVVDKKGRKMTLHDVRSILEICDEENETLGGISFHSKGKWVNFRAAEFEEIRIRRQKKGA